MSTANIAPPSGPSGRSHRLIWVLGIAGALLLGVLGLIGGCTAILMTIPEDSSPAARTQQPTEDPIAPKADSAAEAETTVADSAQTAGPTDPPASKSSSPEPDEGASTPPQAPVEPPSYSGSGAEVVILDPLGEDVFYATVTHDGSSNVALWSVDENGQDIDLLVNEIGDYEGAVPINFSGDPAALRIEADGDWTIEFHHLAEAPRWDGTGAYEARGDGVLIVDGAAEGLTPVTLTHDGESNFAGWAYGDGSYADLIVNEIGTYEGTMLLPDGSLVLVITADGLWSIAKA